MPPTELIVIRHGETQWNLDEKRQGHQDSPLTSRGIRQAKAMAARLASMDFSALYTSDLGRAAETARIIGARIGQRPQGEPRLRERNLGVFEGLTTPQIVERYPDVYRQHRKPDFRVPQGETGRELFERVVDCLEQIARNHPGQRVVVVTHGGALSALFRRCIGLPLEAERTYLLMNASMNRIRIEDGKWMLVTWGDTSHLSADGALGDS